MHYNIWRYSTRYFYLAWIYPKRCAARYCHYTSSLRKHFANWKLNCLIKGHIFRGFDRVTRSHCSINYQNFHLICALRVPLFWRVLLGMPHSLSLRMKRSELVDQPLKNHIWTKTLLLTLLNVPTSMPFIQVRYSKPFYNFVLEIWHARRLRFSFWKLDFFSSYRTRRIYFHRSQAWQHW